MHAKHQKSSGSEDTWIGRTRLMREWKSVKEQIHLHKSHHSEKAGHDIGWERAKVKWLLRHGSRRHEDNQSNESSGS